MLGVLVFPSQLVDVVIPGLIVACVLVFVARPIAVFVRIGWMRYKWRELVLTAWVRLRGAVPIMLATFPFVAGYPDGEFIFDIVFFVVLVSAAVQGISISTVAGWLGLRQAAPETTSVAEDVPIGDINNELVEVRVTDELHIAGRQLQEITPSHGLITSIIRGNGCSFPPRGPVSTAATW